MRFRAAALPEIGSRQQSLLQLQHEGFHCEATTMVTTVQCVTAFAFEASFAMGSRQLKPETRKAIKEASVDGTLTGLPEPCIERATMSPAQEAYVRLHNEQAGVYRD